jgi:hypothetical protein
MVSKAADINTFLSHLELLLRYHEGSNNNTDSFRVYEALVDGRQAAVLKRLDDLLITKGKGGISSEETNGHKATVGGDPIRRDPIPEADVGTVCPQHSSREF